MSQATKPVENARWPFVDRPLCHEFRAVVCAIRVAAIVGLNGLASIALGASGRIIGMKTFGASAPLKELQRKFGFEPDQVAAAKELLGRR